MRNKTIHHALLRLRRRSAQPYSIYLFTMKVLTVCVWFTIVITSNITKGNPTNEYPDFNKPVPYRDSRNIIFKQPPVQSTPEEDQLAYDCAILPCEDGEIEDVLCACNFNTGNVVTFKNGCDMKKHNCRFFTDFKAILGEICPWEFQTRRGNTELVIDYSHPKYYN